MKKLKAAGVTPLVVGGADKWPLHFYWTNLAVRVGGKPAFEAALRDENGGFAGETFVKSGQLFKQLVDLQPFQNGFLGFKNPQAVGAFGDGKAAMTLAISSSYHQQRALAADKKGISDDNLGWFDFPTVAGGKGDPTDTLGGINGWLVTKGAPKETVEFLKMLCFAGGREAAGRRQLPDPGLQGRRRRPRQSVDAHASRRIWRSRNITRTTTTRASAPRSAASSTTSPPKSPAAA